MTTLTDIGTVPQWTLADRLRKARENAGMDQQQLSDRIGMGRTTISNYESGVTAPKRPILLSWSMATGVPLIWLETGNAPQPDGPEGGESVRHQGLEPRTR